MVSRAPVVSPTAIIWHTMGGNTLLSASGSAMVRPLEMLVRAVKIARSTTLLPAVRAVMLSASSIGTPDETSVQRVPKALEDVGEDGDHPDQQDRRDDDRRRHDARRVDHRAFDLALQLGGLLEVVGEAHEDRVEDAADLACLDEARVQVAEDLPVPADRIRERRAGLDVVLDMSEDLPERLRVGLRREDVQALHDRQTRVDHRGELPREDDDVARLYLRADRGHLDLEVETLALFLDAGGLRLNPLRAETDDDGLAARRLHLALQRLPLGRDALPFVDGHCASSACGPSEPRLAEHRPDLLDLRGVADRLVRGDEVLLDEGDQGLGHRLHAELRLTDLHLGVDLVHL